MISRIAVKQAPVPSVWVLIVVFSGDHEVVIVKSGRLCIVNVGDHYCLVATRVCRLVLLDLFTHLHVSLVVITKAQYERF